MITTKGFPDGDDQGQNIERRARVHAQQHTPTPEASPQPSVLGTFHGSAGGAKMLSPRDQVDGNVLLTIHTQHIGRVIEVVAKTAKEHFPDLLDDCAVQVLPLNRDRLFVMVQLNILRFRGRPSDVAEAGRIMMLLVDALRQGGFALDDYWQHLPK